MLKKLPLAEVNEAGRTFPVMQCDAMRLEGRTLFPNVQFTEKNWEVVKSSLTGSKGSCLSRSTANAQNQPKLHPAAIDIQREMLQCSYPYAGAYTNPRTHTHTKLHEPTHAHYIQNFDMLSLSTFVTKTCKTRLKSPSRKQQFLCGMFFLKCITHRCPVTRTRTQPSASTPDGDQST